MSTLKEYQINVINFIGETPCEGYYVLTGLTEDILDSNYINNNQELIVISTGYSFNLIIEDTIQFLYVFIEHCDGSIIPVPDPEPKLQGGYQISLIDLRCDGC